jgi:hypothetical protein
VEEFFRLLEATLVVVADLGNDEGVSLVRDFVAADRDRSFARSGGIRGFWREWREIPHRKRRWFSLFFN